VIPPTVKDAENLAAKPDGAARAASGSALPADSAIKQQPVALEVPVSVNGARAVDGSDKREPFSESTKTVLIFGSGAVIRLSSSVAPGQLLFLTNERTKKEVVCQVVKSKNYRSVSGYVELEFTEPVVGFWGMRFPGDRISSAPQQVTPAPPVSATPSVLPTKPVVPVSAVKDAAPKPSETKTVIPAVTKPEDLLPQKPVAPVAPLSSTLSSSFDPEAPLNVRTTPPPAPVVPVVPAVPVSPAPVESVNSAPVQPVTPVLIDSPRASEVQASFLEPSKAPAAPIAVVPNLLTLFEGKQAATADDSEPHVQVFVDPETETLKKHTARLQEELSRTMFSGESAAPETVSVQIPHASPVPIQKEFAESAAKVLEQSKIHTPEPAPAPRTRVEPVKLESQSAKSLLDDEELKIPAWLEPLARNAATPPSAQEPIEREKAKRVSEQPEVEEIAAETVTPAEGLHLSELPLPTFGSALPLDEVRITRENRPRSSGKGLLLGAIAAGVLALVGGGWWYMQQQSGRVQAGSESASNVQAVATLPVASAPSQPQGNALPQANPPAQSNPAALTNASAQSKSSSNALSVVPAVQSAPAARNPQPLSNPARPAVSAPTSVPAEPPVEEPKKPVLGELHLAKPKVLAGRHAQTVGEPDAGINLNSVDQPDAEGLNSGLAVSNNQPSAPAAPLPVGGDVKQARLISSVPPVYPMLAKNQRVSGNVTIDALIDANGRVTTTKVVSGPTLLQQAAMDALKQWKYQPASLDGKPVSVHLTVTIQFRLP
jgi:periplasmic protein TonB